MVVQPLPSPTPFQSVLNTLADYHFLYIAPGLDAAWLFDAARLYWETFRPIVVSGPELIALVPPDRVVTVTLLTRRDLFERLAVAVSQARQDAALDPIVYDFPEDARITLDERALAQQPFGAPLFATNTPTPQGTNAPARPTIGAVVGGSGFITQTPTPTTDPFGPTPTPAAPDAGGVQPVAPTPGPITGG